MKYKDFAMEEEGFVGHMAEPDGEVKQAVVVIMGGEKSIFPGIKIAEKFADYGILGLSVSLYGAKGLPKGVNLIPVEMFEKAVQYLKEVKHIKSISVYGMSMGSIFAVLTAKYVYDVETGKNVMGMWVAYRNAYKDKNLEQLADIHIEELDSRILMIAGTGDEAWPAEYSVKYLENRLQEAGYNKNFKALIYDNASHLIGMMPSKERNKWLYKMIPFIGLVYKSIGVNKQECLRAFEESEKEIIEWLRT